MGWSRQEEEEEEEKQQTTFWLLFRGVHGDKNDEHIT